MVAGIHETAVIKSSMRPSAPSKALGGSRKDFDSKGRSETAPSQVLVGPCGIFERINQDTNMNGLYCWIQGMKVASNFRHVDQGQSHSSSVEHVAQHSKVGRKMRGCFGTWVSIA